MACVPVLQRGVSSWTSLSTGEFNELSLEPTDEDLWCLNDDDNDITEGPFTFVDVKLVCDEICNFVGSWYDIGVLNSKVSFIFLTGSMIWMFSFCEG